MSLKKEEMILENNLGWNPLLWGKILGIISERPKVLSKMGRERHAKHFGSQMDSFYDVAGGQSLGAL